MSSVVINSESSITVIQTATQVTEIKSSVGPAGANGAAGANGLGVPAGGATGTVLTKVSAADNDTAWVFGGNHLVGIHPVADTEAVLGDTFSTSLDTPVELPNITLNILANQKYTFSLACQARGGSTNGIKIGLRSSNSSKFAWSVEGPNTSSTNTKREELPYPPVSNEFITATGFGANNAFNYIRSEGIIYGGSTDGTIKIIIASVTAATNVYITATSLILNRVP